jgi:hypothetical protein
MLVTLTDAVLTIVIRNDAVVFEAVAFTLTTGSGAEMQDNLNNEKDFRAAMVQT